MDTNTLKRVPKDTRTSEPQKKGRYKGGVKIQSQSLTEKKAKSENSQRPVPKRVRFLDVPEEIPPLTHEMSDSVSNSSDDSFTDPPLPISYASVVSYRGLNIPHTFNQETHPNRDDTPSLADESSLDHKNGPKKPSQSNYPKKHTDLQLPRGHPGGLLACNDIESNVSLHPVEKGYRFARQRAASPLVQVQERTRHDPGAQKNEKEPIILIRPKAHHKDRDIYVP